MVSRGKPAPDLFLHAAHGLGVQPEGCVVIEDSLYGVRGAKIAGMTVIAYAALASAPALRDSGADHVITAMAEAAVLLGLAD
jgi:beta-phosphoglucomutase-like phosphatase (HAD superfamily)